jgi:hypothetical protein
MWTILQAGITKEARRTPPAQGRRCATRAMGVGRRSDDDVWDGIVQRKDADSSARVRRALSWNAYPGNMATMLCDPARSREEDDLWR